MTRRLASALALGVCLALTPTWVFARFVAPDPSAARPTHALSGVASFYAGKFHGRRTASGERYSVHALTAAHRTLPFGARVTVHRGRRAVRVRINDRGPFIRGRVIDLSPRAFRALAPLSAGVVPVRLSIASKR